MRYIIEIEDEPLTKSDYVLWKCKNFRSLVFDEVGLSKLTPYVEPDPAVEYQSYAKGLDEGWRGAAYIANKHGLPYDFFNKFDLYSVVEEMKKYETKYSVGDEIEWKEYSEVFRGILLDQLDFDGNWYVITENGCVERIHESQFHSTGKKYTEVISAVKKLGEH